MLLTSRKMNAREDRRFNHHHVETRGRYQRGWKGVYVGRSLIWLPTAKANL